MIHGRYIIWWQLDHGRWDTPVTELTVPKQVSCLDLLCQDNEFDGCELALRLSLSLIHLRRYCISSPEHRYENELTN
jgi:hypothetical protein